MSRRILPADDDVLATLIAEHTAPGVASIFGVTPAAVYTAAKNRGIPLPAQRTGPAASSRATEYSRAARNALRAVQALVQIAMEEADAAGELCGLDSPDHKRAVEQLRIALQAETATGRALNDFRPYTFQRAMVATRELNGRLTVTDEAGLVRDLGYVVDDGDVIPNAADVALSRIGFVRTEDWHRNKARVRRV